MTAPAPVKDALRFGRSVKAARLDRDWSQRYVAEQLGITQASISNYERGRREPTLFLALAWMRLLGLGVEDAVGRAS